MLPGPGDGGPGRRHARDASLAQGIWFEIPHMRPVEERVSDLRFLPIASAAERQNVA